jgi:hypothetical protein
MRSIANQYRVSAMIQGNFFVGSALAMSPRGVARMPRTCVRPGVGQAIVDSVRVCIKPDHSMQSPAINCLFSGVRSHYNQLVYSSRD